MRNQFLLYSLIVFLCIAASIVFNNKKQMSPVFLVPYFSGAVNYQFPNKWLYIEEEVDTYKFLSAEEKGNYEFVKNTKKASLYNYNYIGLVYIILLSNLLFSWLGDVTALEVLQIVAHTLLSLCILSVFKEKTSKLLFFFLYMINPLILYIVTFPFYYFWQVLASAILLPYLISPTFRYRNWVFLIALYSYWLFLPGQL
jgi:hypothetical protein